MILKQAEGLKLPVPLLLYITKIKRFPMKQFRKTQDKFFICEECGKLCKDKTVLSIHNKKVHNLTPKEYFDKWIKEIGDDICVICQEKTILVRSDFGYKKCCSRKCENIYSGQRTIALQAISVHFSVSRCPIYHILPHYIVVLEAPLCLSYRLFLCSHSPKWSSQPLNDDSHIG
jgi:hypothetical protein